MLISKYETLITENTRIHETLIVEKDNKEEIRILNENIHNLTFDKK